MAKSYLVTGGTGFIGAALSCLLVEQGNRVRVLDNGTRGHTRRLGGYSKEVEFVEGDVRDPDVVSKAMSGIDSVCHLACINGTRFFYERPSEVLDVSVKGMTNVLDACRNHAVPEIILASSAEVYHPTTNAPVDESAPLVVPDVLNPRYSYSGGKIISELLCINHARDHLERLLIFRPTNVYGPDMGHEHVIPAFIDRLGRLTEKQPRGIIGFRIQGDGKQTRAFIYIDDLIQALDVLLKHGEHLNIYNIGSEEVIAVFEIAQRIARLYGREIEIKPGPPPAGEKKQVLSDTTKIRALGFKPQVDFNLGLLKTFEWYVNHRTIGVQ